MNGTAGTTAAIDEHSVDVDGRRLFVRRSGPAGSMPSVVLESGGGTTCAEWAHVQKGLSDRATVISYDRCGIGRSEAAPQPVAEGAACRRLRLLLQREGVAPPYLLVGHSLGALFVQAFARCYPEDTYALVLVDPTPNDRALFRTSARLIRLYAAILGFCLRATAALPSRGVEKAAGDRPGPFPSRRRHLGSFVQELRRIEPLQAGLTKAPVHKEVPTLIVSAGSHLSRRAGRAIVDHRSKMAGESPAGCHVVVDGATHLSLLRDGEHARKVVDAILAFAG